WSADVCSSDLAARGWARRRLHEKGGSGARAPAPAGASSWRRQVFDPASVAPPSPPWLGVPFEREERAPEVPLGAFEAREERDEPRVVPEVAPSSPPPVEPTRVCT